MHFLFEKRKPDKQLAVVEKVLSLLLFVEFEIIGSSAGWMRAENTLIQTAGYAFRKAAGEILRDFEAEFSKTKTLGAGVRIFNGTVRTEREFPLKILFLACIQGFVVLLILRNGGQNLPSRFPNMISVYSVSKYFRTFIQSHAADKFKYYPPLFCPEVSGCVGCDGSEGSVVSDGSDGSDGSVVSDGC